MAYRSDGLAIWNASLFLGKAAGNGSYVDDGDLVGVGAAREMVLGRRRISPLKKMVRRGTTLRFLGCGNSSLGRRILLEDILIESREGGRQVSSPVSQDIILDRVMRYVGCFSRTNFAG